MNFKKIKWICLIIGIIGVIALSILFIKNKENDNSKLSNIYNISWFKTKRQTYENDILTSDFNLIDTKYIIFNKKYIEYHDTKDGIALPSTDYKYIYKDDDKILKIYGPTEFLLEGTYEISLENEELKLVLNEENKKTVYYFTKAVG